jgi:hypothetical protein
MKDEIKKGWLAKKTMRILYISLCLSVLCGSIYSTQSVAFNEQERAKAVELLQFWRGLKQANFEDCIGYVYPWGLICSESQNRLKFSRPN